MKHCIDLGRVKGRIAIVFDEENTTEIKEPFDLKYLAWAKISLIEMEILSFHSSKLKTIAEFLFHLYVLTNFVITLAEKVFCEKSKMVNTCKSLYISCSLTPIDESEYGV